jgi:hypothetical protein
LASADDGDVRRSDAIARESDQAVWREQPPEPSRPDIGAEDFDEERCDQRGFCTHGLFDQNTID